MKYPEIISYLYSERDKNDPIIKMIDSCDSILPKDLLDFHRKFDVKRQSNSFPEGHSLTYNGSQLYEGFYSFEVINNFIDRPYAPTNDSVFFDNKMIPIGAQFSEIYMSIAPWFYGQIWYHDYHFLTEKVADDFEEFLSYLKFVRDDY